VRFKSAAQTSVAQQLEKQTIFKIHLFDPKFLRIITGFFAHREIHLVAAGLKL
jgi:hypothetical protein